MALFLMLFMISSPIYGTTTCALDGQNYPKGTTYGRYICNNGEWVKEIAPDDIAFNAILCDIPMTTQSGDVKCDLISGEQLSILCSLPEFGNISTKAFTQIPTQLQLSEAFKEECYNTPECAEKFKCSIDIDPTDNLDIQVPATSKSGGE